jgi:hypothetical protein
MGRLILLMRKTWTEGKHPRDERGRFSLASDTGLAAPLGNNISEEKQAAIWQRLESLTVPILKVEYSIAEYNKYFPEGTVKTPIKIVKMGSDQFAKLGRKDSGGRQSYIGAAYQTLTDPVAIIKEGNDDVYTKSFTNEKGFSTFMSVEKDKEDGRFVVTNYMRHKEEIAKKIKRADSIAFLKNDRGSPARMDKGGVPHAIDSHTPILSPKPLKKSSPRLMIKRSLVQEMAGRQRQAND